MNRALTAEAERYPFVSALIPIRNEERHIARCLDSILAGDYPTDRLEVLVIDGMSTDRSRSVVLEYSKRYPRLRLLENPRRIIPTALNIGIAEARGQVIIRMDAHATYAPDYVRQCVTLLQTTGAANVGGVLAAVGTDYASNAVAVATTSPFGIGDARYRYASREEWADTAFLGAWYKQTLEELGGFNEGWTVNQDYELNYRLRRAGGKILLSPRIRCEYYVRSSLRLLAHQYFRYGLWRVKTLIAHPDSLRWRQLPPPALVLVALLSLVILPVNRMLGLAAPALYLAASLLASIWAASRRGWKYLPLLPFLFATIHLSWGTGFLAGLFRWGVPKITWSSLVGAFQPTEGSRTALPSVQGRAAGGGETQPGVFTSDAEGSASSGH